MTTVNGMDEFEVSDLEKQTDDSYNTVYQNAIQYKERRKAFNNKCGIFSLALVIKPGERMTDIF